MSWQNAFLRWFGPGMLGGVTFGNWLQLLVDNRFAISPEKLIRASAITSMSLQNSVIGWIEDWRCGAAVRASDVSPPVFILGHWRSGTTHLHNLMTIDRRFAYPNNFDALFPNAMLLLERMQSPFIQ